MEPKETIQDVERILAKHKDNINARRFLQSEKAKQVILDRHLAWNEDHLKMGRLEMVYSLESSVEYCLDVPQVINSYLI